MHFLWLAGCQSRMLAESNSSLIQKSCIAKSCIAESCIAGSYYDIGPISGAVSKSN
jgi:hypothetical protein